MQSPQPRRAREPKNAEFRADYRPTAIRISTTAPFGGISKPVFRSVAKPLLEKVACLRGSGTRVSLSFSLSLVLCYH